MRHTVKDVIEWLMQFAPELEVRAYQGEGTSVIIVDRYDENGRYSGAQIETD